MPGNGTLARRQPAALAAAPEAGPCPRMLTRFSLLPPWGPRPGGRDWGYIDCLQYLGNNENRNDGPLPADEALYREVLWLDPASTTPSAKAGPSWAGTSAR